MKPISTKKNKITLEVIGGNNNGVTGSCTLIKTNKTQYLFECGMIQDGHTVLENYKRNNDYIKKINTSDIDVIIVGHLHVDHIGMIPALYSKGKCNAKIILPKKSTAIFKEMLLDCAYINNRDIEALNIKRDTKLKPLYSEEDVYTALQYVEEYDSNIIQYITDELSVRFSPAGHIFLSQQVEVFININNHVKKILFTSDLGNVITQNSRVYVEPFKPVYTSNIVIGECTYSAKDRGMKISDYKKDLQKIKAVIQKHCIDSNNRVLIPTFSLDRCPYLLWILYQLFGDDETFKVPIIIDSPLTIRLLKIYSELLEGDKKETFDKILTWKNIRLIKTPEDSKAAISEKSRKIILSSSGMLTAGRSIKWTQNILPKENDCILFCGYAGENTLAWKIKHGNMQKTITINGVTLKNKCQIVDLKSFSSHMQREDLINYYKTINCDKIYLVHGNKEDKIIFKHDLESAISDCLKTTRIVAVNSGLKITL